MSFFSTSSYTVPSPSQCFQHWRNCFHVFLSFWRGGFGETEMAEEGDGGTWRGALAAGAAEQGGVRGRNPTRSQRALCVWTL